MHLALNIVKTFRLALMPLGDASYAPGQWNPANFYTMSSARVGCSTVPETLPLLLSQVVPTMSLTRRNFYRFGNWASLIFQSNAIS